MTVSTTTSSVGPYSCNGSTTEFPVTFPFLEDDDLVVYLIDSNGDSTTLTIDTHYTVTGAGGASGTVTTVATYASGNTILIDRVVDLLQETDLENQATYYPEVLEDALDKLTMIAQQLYSGVSRSIKFPTSDMPITDPVLPSRDERLGKFLQFDSVTGQPIVTPQTISVADYTGMAFETVADLRLSDPDSLVTGQMAVVAGYYAAGDGGGGPLRVWQTSGAPYTDNGGSVIVPTSGDGTGAWVFEDSGPMNIQWFGASVNNADNSADISAAITAANGLPLYLPPGVLPVENKITVSTNLNMVGQKGQSIISGVDGSGSDYYVFEIADGVTSVRLDGIGFTSADYALYASNSATLIDVFSVKNCSFYDIRHAVGILDTRASNVAAGTPISVGVKRLEIVDNTFDGLTDGSVIVSARTIEDALVRGNRVTDCSRRWLQLGNNFVPPVTVNLGRYIVANNVINDLFSTGGQETQAIILYGERASVYGNHIENVRNETYEDCEGVYLKCRNSEVYGNTLKDCMSITSGGSITVKTIDDEDGNMDIHNNIITFSAEPDTIETIGVFSSTAGEISHNTIERCGKHGIYAADYGKSIKIHGNKITNTSTTLTSVPAAASAICVSTVPTQATFAAGSTEDRIYAFSIEDNEIWNCKRQGIFVNFVYGDAIPDLTSIKRNYIRNVTGSTAYGIQVYSNAATPNPVPVVEVIDNVFDTMAYAVRLESGSLQASAYKTKLIFDGNVTQNFTTAFTISPELGKITYGRNYGQCVTNASGTATIAAGATDSGTLTSGVSDVGFTGMGLALQDIEVIPTSDIGSASKWWVTIVSGANGTFQINTNVAPGGSGATFAWRVSRYRELERS